MGESSTGAPSAAALRDDATADWGTLRRRYNFHTVSDRRAVLVGLLVDEARRLRAGRRWVRALDIGSGTGISEEPGTAQRYLGRVREAVDELWGVEPDPSVTPAPGIDRVFHSTLEELDTGGETVQLAYSYMVQEHVDDANRFFSALYAHLAPGGVYLGLTVNGRHCFARITKLLRRLRLDELVLRVAFRSHDNSYHYPVRYRCNDTTALRTIAMKVGFLPPEFVTLESHDARRYFKGPLKPLYALLQWKRRVWRQPDALLVLIMRLTKPAASR